MVERIERLQQTRQVEAAPPPRPRAAARPVSGEGRLFEWESDASGHIAWVEGAPRGALVGRPLGGDGVGLLERQAASRLGQRHPFVDVPLAVGEPLAGSWTATGVPAFDPATGRFLGYRGLARRTDGAAPATPVEPGDRHRRAARTGPRDQDAAQRDHRVRRDHRRPVSRPRPPQLSRARGGTSSGRRASCSKRSRTSTSPPSFAPRGQRPARRGAFFGPVPAVSVDRTVPRLHGGVLEVDIDDDRHRCALPPELAEPAAAALAAVAVPVVSAGETFRLAVSRARRDVPADGRQAARGSTASARSNCSTRRSIRKPATSAGRPRLRASAGARAGPGRRGQLVIDEQRITLELPAPTGDRLGGQTGLRRRHGARLSPRPRWGL